MKFRRSRPQSEKHESAKAVQIAIPQKDAMAIEPPKKVIKAIYDYTAPADSDYCLSFSAGDFLHVIAREGDQDWYEACNPLKNERGLVPVRFFEEVGKTVRDSAESMKSGSATHDSGYAEGTMPPPPSRSFGGSSYDVAAPGHRSSRSTARGVGGGVYGVVVYDFRAERADELDAREGEAIIVIAQSNEEWFVAKPITRLGGPGLIPVSFIELRDMSTGQAVANPLEAVKKAGIPRVEEWKKMAAEYKNTSIPLGMVSSSQQIQSMQQGLNRMSLNDAQQNGLAHEYTYQQQQQENPYAPVRASVPRYIFADEKFHFIVECKLSNGTHWDLSRIYEDFYQLQIALISAFPEESGQIPGTARILPYMPGPVKFVTDNISEGRRSSLNDYLRDLLLLQQHITCSALVRSFFAPRPGDYEVDPNAVDVEEHARNYQPEERYSDVSQKSDLNGGLQQQQPQTQNNTTAYQPTYPNGYAHQPPQPQSLQPTAQEPQRGHSQSPSSSHQQAPPSQSANASGLQVKVKAWFDRDTCVVLRMPPRGHFDYNQLLQRIIERRRLEYKGQDHEDDNLDIEYRDGKDGEYYRLEGDEDLDIAVERNEKLTLAVRTATAAR